MFVKTLFIFVAAVLLSGMIAPALALNDMEIVKRIVLPACSGDSSTPKPAICGQLARLSSIGSGVHPVSLRREVEDLARRYVLLGCNGDPATRPAHCSQAISTGSLAGHKFNALRRSALSDVERIAKRIVNLRCSGDPAEIPADCFNQPVRTGPKVGGHTLNVLQLRDEMAAIELAKRIVLNSKTRKTFRAGGTKFSNHILA
ncbi:hypothetical protein QCA50_004984 [Cerrena zonata]|uniref:Uncharacterized protein n=1 Tax=Cerrena zonata TaxID=2478898 RepID=A0AAW0GQU6_9APHY